jgi:hypothetical protein
LQISELRHHTKPLRDHKELDYLKGRLEDNKSIKKLPQVENYHMLMRLMNEPKYEGLLYAGMRSFLAHLVYCNF